MDNKLKVWPLFTKPLEDELLTSWMIRNAHNHYQKVYTFYRYYISQFSHSKAKIWTIDLDLNPRKDILEIISLNTDTPLEETLETTCKYFEGRLIEKASDGHSKWFLPQGHYHSKNKRHSILYCPGCLSKDATPYFRKKWKLSLSFCCPDCRLMLRETCWNCGSGVNFIRTELGEKHGYNFDDLHTCCECQADLREAKSAECTEEDVHVQQTLYKYIKNGFTPQLNYSHLYFDGLYQLCTIMVSSHKRTLTLQRKVARECGIKYKPLLDQKESTFDYLETRLRRDILVMAFWMAQEWPERFLNTMKETDTGKFVQFINKPKEVKLPFWYSSVSYTPGPYRKSG